MLIQEVWVPSIPSLLDDFGKMCDNRSMNDKEPFPRRSILNWLGLALFGLLVFGLVRSTQDDQPAAERQEASSPASVTDDLSSPLPAALLAPTSPAQESPLVETSRATLAPTALSSPLPSPTALPESTVAHPSPTEPPQKQPAGADRFQVTVLHTNDTWGYLNPCG